MLHVTLISFLDSDHCFPALLSFFIRYTCWFQGLSGGGAEERAGVAERASPWRRCVRTACCSSEGEETPREHTKGNALISDN